ncbi:hypothetical protein Halar_1717 [halophilic archaeon DL31]|jgi:hypothetical protein|nr:hypothetical protein Halar_1717 [halophilic archaeon DL31]
MDGEGKTPRVGFVRAHRRPQSYLRRLVDAIWHGLQRLDRE